MKIILSKIIFFIGIGALCLLLGVMYQQKINPSTQNSPSIYSEVLIDIDGNKVHLSKFKGKWLVLNFWATWCGPCRKGLPVLMEVAKARANDNVVLWAVDLDESKSKVQDFLKKKGWNLPVLLDAKGKVSQKYGVGGIPHTVVIGPDGVIHSVEIGFGGKDATMKKLNAAIDQIKGS